MSEPPASPSKPTPDSAHAIAELRKHAEILRLVQANLPICVWAIDLQGTFIYHEGKGLSTAGIKPGQFLGMNIFELYTGSETRIASIKLAMAGEVANWMAVTHGVYWETWVVPARDEQGQVTSVVGITLDVSDARRAEQMLREKIELIERQEAAIRALSTPIIEVWDKVLTLPLLGVVDSGRSATVMDNLLTDVTRKGARFAILDLTGVEAMDTSTSSHLIKLVQAIRLLGAEGIITGIQPGVAQTMISLGVDLGTVKTLATLRDGLQHCIAQMRDGA